MGKITEKRKAYAKALAGLGVDLSLDYFAQPSDKLQIVSEQADLFHFKRTSLVRTRRQQFYYAAQTGNAHLSEDE